MATTAVVLYFFFTGVLSRGKVGRRKEDWARPREDLEEHQLATSNEDVALKEERPHRPSLSFHCKVFPFFFYKINISLSTIQTE
jgi:hypothetical protein